MLIHILISLAQSRWLQCANGVSHCVDSGLYCFATYSIRGSPNKIITIVHLSWLLPVILVSQFCSFLRSTIFAFAQQLAVWHETQYPSPTLDEMFAQALLARGPARSGGVYEIDGLLYECCAEKPNPNDSDERRKPVNPYNKEAEFKNKLVRMRERNEAIRDRFEPLENRRVGTLQDSFKRIFGFLKSNQNAYAGGANAPIIGRGSRRQPVVAVGEQKSHFSIPCDELRRGSPLALSSYGIDKSSSALNARLVTVDPDRGDGAFLHAIDCFLQVKDQNPTPSVTVSETSEKQITLFAGPGCTADLISVKSSCLVGRGGLGAVLEAQVHDRLRRCIECKNDERETSKASNDQEITYAVKFVPVKSQHDFLRARELNYNELAIQRYIGLLRANGGTRAGLSRISAYGLVYSKDQDLSGAIPPPKQPMAKYIRKEYLKMEVERRGITDPAEQQKILDEYDQRTEEQLRKCPEGYAIVISELYPQMPTLKFLIEAGLKHPEKALSLRKKKIISRNLIQAVLSLADWQFYHTDVKPENFLVNSVTGEVNRLQTF